MVMIRSALVDIFTSKDLRQTLKTLFSPCEVQDGLTLSSSSLTSKIKTGNKSSSNKNFESNHIASTETFDNLKIKKEETETNQCDPLKANENIKDVSAVTFTSTLNCNSVVGTATPTLSMVFSPFLNFSDDRTVSSSKKLNFNEFTVPCKHYGELMTLDVEITTDLISNKSLNENETTNNGDVLILSNADSRRSSLYLPGLMGAQEDIIQEEKTRNSTGKKRNSSHAFGVGRLDRQPQKRFSLESLKSRDDSSDDLFGSRKDGRMRLTTNIPRQVEAVNPTTRERIQVFASCSEASRIMDINRTRMSRSKLMLIDFTKFMTKEFFQVKLFFPS